MAEKMLLYVLATLLHSFEWKLAKGTEVDLSDECGLALMKKEPLIAIPAAKLLVPQHHYYNPPQLSNQLHRCYDSVLRWQSLLEGY
ncbi:hypothetical protein JRO89_XS11G0161500 [Xanthoceras sorbifolium]|uniref:Uncharacterized protein n=1 Tax=Xanthoceras sorbifolium TaxID=99658 RepID=A0ABQ8HFS6_9ROSI|nr:hypothetical protein JRO89_XS11G0161500 [Xanthoceras sorbifolium]